MDYFGAADLTVPQELTVRTIPLPWFSEVQLQAEGCDDRGGERHARKMLKCKTLPPIIVADGYVVDGQHRLWAAQAERQWGRKTIDAIDLSGIGLIGREPPLASIRATADPRPDRTR